MYTIKIVRGNIVNVTTEAIVNPANNNLMPGGGANKMIFYASGDRLIEECAKLKYCETGKAVYTSGFNIPAKYIIHAVGPYWHGGYDDEAKELLKQAFDFLYGAVKKEQPITEDFIKAIHAFVLRGDEEAGQYRKIQNYIGSADKTEKFVERLISSLDQIEKHIGTPFQMEYETDFKELSVILEGYEEVIKKALPILEENAEIEKFEFAESKLGAVIILLK